MKVKIETDVAARLYGCAVGDFRDLQGQDAAGLIASGDVSEVPAEGRPLDGMTVDQLKAYAETHQIDLGTATKKADIRAVIDRAESAVG